jgi:hypothetical protein
VWTGESKKSAMKVRIVIKTGSPSLAQMTFAEFREAITAGGMPPTDLSAPLLALWHDANGDWGAAHVASQADSGRDGAWVHAYLHRKEGDLGNANYWYVRAGRTPPPPNTSFAAEWADIAQHLLGR